jgi:hypothetical protein
MATTNEKDGTVQLKLDLGLGVLALHRHKTEGTTQIYQCHPLCFLSLHPDHYFTASIFPQYTARLGLLIHPRRDLVLLFHFPATARTEVVVSPIPISCVGYH